MSARPKKLSPEAVEVLANMRVAGPLAYIADQLDRKLYVEVNAALEALGGKWQRKEKAHRFEEEPRAAIEQVVVDGCFSDHKKDLQQFYTPWVLATRLVEMTRPNPLVDRALEPSAGAGILVDALRPRVRHVTAIELDPKNVTAMQQRMPANFVTVVEGDFLQHHTPSRYDVIVMNPPFAGQADIDHVTHAMTFLSFPGRLVAVMSAGTAFRTNRKAVEFRDRFAAAGGLILPLPDGSFSESGTDVRTVVATIGTLQ